MLINKTDMVIISEVVTKKCKFCVNLQRSDVVWAVLKLLHLQKQPFKQYILYSLIIKLEDSKDSEDSNCVYHNKYIGSQRKEVNRSHFLS